MAVKLHIVREKLDEFVLFNSDTKVGEMKEAIEALVMLAIKETWREAKMEINRNAIV